MAKRYTKTAKEKFQTKLKNLLKGEKFTVSDNQVKVDGRNLFTFTDKRVIYNGINYYPTQIDPYVDRDYSVVIPIRQENMSLISSSLYNPPYGIRYVHELFRGEMSDIKRITIGSKTNSLKKDSISLTSDLYNIILKINKEENQSKRARFSSRIAPILKENLDYELKIKSVDRDYGIMLTELLASGELGKNDILRLISKADEGEEVQVIIDKQINKQIEWLLEKMEDIIDVQRLTTPICKDLGKTIFGYNKIDVKGPEQFMEKILTDYGQYTLFGVPALLNTDKYVVNSTGITRSQFDLILINHLGEIEVVELKRPDQHVLSFDAGRRKFYASKDLSIAVSQSERYISAVVRDNDEEYQIKGKKLRDYINDEIGGVIHVETVRPTALIVIGASQRLCKDYKSLSSSVKSKISKDDYDRNSILAYRELKNAFRNIKVLTYSELLENARTRLQISKEQLVHTEEDIGILAYGSLINDPGSELDSIISHRITHYKTPFKVEYARKSSKRGGAPTLVPVREGGSSVDGTILMIKPGIDDKTVKDMLYRRELNIVGDDEKEYPDRKKRTNDRQMLIHIIEDVKNARKIMYAEFAPNIKRLTPSHLAKLAIKSFENLEGTDLNGVKYLENNIEKGIVTPLTEKYKQAIFKNLNIKNFKGAYKKLFAEHNNNANR